MPSTENPQLSELAPLALVYHENSKLNCSTAARLADAVGEFSADADARRRSITAAKTYPTADRIDLACVARQPRCNRPLCDVLSRRRSVRQFSPRGLSLSAVAAMLQSAGGISGESEDQEEPGLVQLLRAAPSGGALYPIETYLVAFRPEGFEQGIYHYHAPQHALETVRQGNLRDRFESLILTASEPLAAPALLVLAARWETPFRKYGERGYRVLLLDAGHVAQNLLLTAVALDLAACPIAGFHDDALGAELGLDPASEPVVYVILVGYPRD